MLACMYSVHAEPNMPPYYADHSMEQHALKNVNNCLNTNIYTYLETSGGQSSIYI